MQNDLLTLGKILAPHGVQGVLKLLSFTEPTENIFDYAPLYLADGRAVRLQSVGMGRHKGHNVWLARIFLASDAKTSPLNRQAIEPLIGQELYLPRANLPPPEDSDSFYHADLIQCQAVDESGQVIGIVTALHDFGAGTFLVVQRADQSETFIPFTRAAVPEINIKNRVIRVEWGDEEEESLGLS
ncbi:MAG: ribosome maturation factor RimM [Alphaproteobacteria bacterium]|nr:ribosome maturation factor RimM [Alphaproteobacteria bacterium]